MAVQIPRLRVPFAPACFAVLGAWLALTPSLLPRAAVLQGALCAVVGMLAYAVGALIGWVARGLGLKLRGRPRRIAWRCLAVAGAVGSIVVLVVHVRQQQRMGAAIGVDTVGLIDIPVIVLVAAAVGAALLAVSRLIRAAGRLLGRLVGKVLPPNLGRVLGAAVVAVAVLLGINASLTGKLLTALDSAFMLVNDEFRTETPAPTGSHLSAGPASDVTWDDLGRQGRLFIAAAPTGQQISEFTGKEGLDPVRAYVGVGGDRLVELRGQAEEAVDELERLGGFDRAVINIVTGTGRGWVNENQSRALEYMWNGDTATVSLQYSYLPSWLSFLVDTQRAQDAGRFLFEAVYARWQDLPDGDRPLLVVSGESLGSFGGEAAFSGAQDMAERTAGALFVGPTGNNRLWSRFTAERDAGTPEVLPTYQQGINVRFADTPEDWDRPGTDWPQPRIGYLQHANDPITWWDGSLAFERPDWLREPRGRGVLPETTWVPVVTWLQLAADQLVASAVPDGQGHEFGQAPVVAWARILPSPGWSDGDTEIQR